MSIRLYHMTTEYTDNREIIKTIHNKIILNLSSDFDYYEKLCEYANVYSNEYGELGYLEINKDDLKEFYKNNNKNMDQELKNNFKELIKYAEDNGIEWLQFYAY